MPELPEVETLRKQLDFVLAGKVIKKVEVRRAKSFEGDKREIIGGVIEKIERRAKMIFIGFEMREIVLMIHLKMTGQLVYRKGKKEVYGGHPSPDWVEKLPSRHTRVVLYFQDGGKLFFNDLRVFGWMRIVSVEEKQRIFKNLPYDVIDRKFSLTYFHNKLKKTGRMVKEVLMDQKLFGGIGNIYANDGLFLAGVLPTRRACDLTEQETQDVYRGVKKVINKGIRMGGASSSNYVNLSGLGGRYQDHFLVYKREGKECVRCGAEIVRKKVKGRSAFYCVKCQN